MISKCSTRLQSELMHDNLIKFFCEWCETPDCRQSGCCFDDCIFLYDRRGKPIYMLDRRSPFHHIYTGINQSLLDPVLESAIEKTEKMYQRTFWAIMPSFIF